MTTRVIAFSERASEDGLQEIRQEMLQALSHEEYGQKIVDAIQEAIQQAIVDAAKLQSPATSHAHTAAPATT